MQTEPKDLEDFALKGFLSDYTQSGVERFRQGMADWVDCFERINGLAIRALRDCVICNRDAIALLALSTFSRALATFQGSFILAARGLDCDSKSLQRSLTEDSILISACVRNRPLVEKFIRSTEEHRRKAINGLLNTARATKNLLPDEITQLQKEQQLLTTQKRANVLPNVTYQELAEKGGSKPVFDVHYRHLCIFAHPSPTGLAQELVYKDGQIVGIRSGPDYHDAHGNLSTATFLMLRMIEDVDSIFSLGIKHKIEKLRMERDALNEQWFPRRNKAES
jgi:hypothetical protein